MAETHLQINHNGSISEAKTSLLLNDKEFREKRLIQLFSINNWMVKFIDNPKSCLWKLIVNNADNELKLNVFLSTVRDEARRADEFKSQFGGLVDPNEYEEGWINLPMGVYVKNEDDEVDKWLLVAYESSGINFKSNPSLRGVRTNLLQEAQQYGLIRTPFSILFRPEFIYYVVELFKEKGKDSHKCQTGLKKITFPESQGTLNNSYLRAMRTKPFLLLAGISGTGKSRIVKQMAFDSCTNEAELRKDPTSPGNYCLIEVKPNWHDSTELLGYESKIGGPNYQLTNFVRFLVKAMRYPDTPFFVCLDEMNLAPVEQYFAEFLSVLESRTKIGGKIVSEALVKPGIFANKDYELKLQDDLFGLELKEETTADGQTRIISGRLSERDRKIYDTLKEHGLRIPQNVTVIGTVNMDETTHQFSRKVIDRAMTIEMNLPEGNPFMDFFDNASQLEYREVPNAPELYLANETKASDVIDALSEIDEEKTDKLKEDVARILTQINEALDDTPFKVAYRVQNELLLYFYQLILELPEAERGDADWDALLATSTDQILMMKVLPRVEGDEELLEKPLGRLAALAANYKEASKKIKEMSDRLDRARFTSFWP